MNKAERVTFVINTLKAKYPTIPIPLDHKDPYTLLIAVLLSAQCTDVRVNKITPLLFARADNPYDMVKLSVEEIKESKILIIKNKENYFYIKYN
jgi:endonuclease-3